QNTCVVQHRVLEGRSPVTLELRPTSHFRSHDDAVDVPDSGEYTVRENGHGIEISHRELRPCLRVRTSDCSVVHRQPGLVQQLRYRIEESRGYAYMGTVWAPGIIACRLGPGEANTLVASTEPWDAMPEPEFQPQLDAELR